MHYQSWLKHEDFNQEAMFRTSITWNCKKPTIAKRNDILYWSWVYGWTDIQIKKLVNELTKRNNLIANELKNKFE